MFRSLSTLAICCFTIVPLALTGACSDSTAPAAPSRVASGAVSMPLTTTVNSSTYRLDATLYLIGDNGTFDVLSSSTDPSETALRATLSTGSYTAELVSWTLQKEADDGSFGPVPATLLSSSYLSFDIDNGTTTTISYRFQTDGVEVVVGSGEARVTVEVDEIAPACRPFGSDCAEGTWCAPAGLRGATLACVPAGTVALGEPCLAPSDCVATSSCIDAGSGPVCTEICAKSAFGQACASGGTCEQAAADYGVCR